MLRPLTCSPTPEQATTTVRPDGDLAPLDPFDALLAPLSCATTGTGLVRGKEVPTHPRTEALLASQVLSDDGGQTVVWITHEPIGLDRVDTVVDLDRPRGEVRSA